MMKKTSPLSGIFCVLAFTLPLILIGGAGCGQARGGGGATGTAASEESSSRNQNKSGGSSVNPENGTTAAFRLKVYQAAKDQNLPAKDQGGGLEEVVAEADVLQLRNRIPLADSKKGDAPLFLIFPEKLGDRTILQASYDFRQQRVANDFHGAVTPRLVSRPRGDGFWFIPLAEIFEAPGAIASPLDQQVITLDLLLNGDVRRKVEVRFLIQPPAVDLSQVKVPGVDSLFRTAENPQRDYAWDEIQLGNRDGFIVSSQTYRNPTTRPLTLWYRPSESPVQLQTLMAMKILWDCGPNISHENCMASVRSSQQPEFEVDQYHVSRTQLRANRIRVVRKTGDRKLEFAAKEEWKPIQLAAGEEIQLQWLATPVAGTPPCAHHVRTMRVIWLCFGAPQNQIFQRSRCQGGSEFSGPTNQPAEWEAVGLKLQSTENPEVLLTEEGVTPLELAELRADPRIKAAEATKTPLHAAFGLEVQENLPDYSCQGSFL